MNLRIARAFWFAHFTRTWPFVLTGLLAGGGVALAYFGVYYDDVEETLELGFTSDRYLIGMLAVAIPIQLLGLLYNSSGTGSFSCQLPEFSLLLPVSSVALAFHRFTFNLSVTATTTLCLYGLTWILFEQPLNDTLYWLVITVGLCAFLQFVALFTAPSGDWTIAFIVVAALLHLTTLLPVDSDELTFHGALIVLSFLGNWANIHFIRQGLSLAPASPSREASHVTLRHHKGKSFKSAWHAQLWLETRTYWRPIIRIFLATAALYVTLMVTYRIRGGNAHSRLNPSSILVFLTTLGYCAFAAFIFGGVFASLQNRRLQTGPMAAFLYIRPLSTTRLGSVRIVAALRVWAGFAAVVTLVSFMDVSMSGNRPLADTSQVLALSVPITFLLWAALWTWNLFVILFLYAIGLLISTVLAFGYMPLADTYMEFGWPIAVTVAVAAMFVLVVRQRLLHSKLIASFPALVFVLMILWTREMFPYQPLAMDGGTLPDYLSILACYAFVIAPLATVPLSHHWCRHR